MPLVQPEGPCLSHFPGQLTEDTRKLPETVVIVYLNQKKEGGYKASI